MKNELSADNRVVLKNLLSKLGGWTDGAIDTWTLVCMDNLVSDRHQFLLNNCEKMRSLVCVSGMFLAEAHLADEEPISTLLDRLTDQCHKLQNAFLVLEKFRVVPLEKVRCATDALAEVHKDLLGAIEELGNVLELQLSYWPSHTPKWEQYFQRILHGLFELFRHEREGKQTNEAASSATI